MTSCPRCGGPARIGDGVFSYSAGEVRLINGPVLTRAMIDKIAAIAKRAKERVKKEATDAEELLREVAEVSPELADRLKSKHALPTVVLILILIWLVKGVSIDVKVDLNKLIDQAHHHTSGEHSEDYLEAPPPPFDENPPLSMPVASIAAMARPSPVGLNRRERRRRKAKARKHK